MRRAARSMLALLALLAGCTRSEQTIDLMAAFSDDTIVGHLEASWHTAEERTGENVAERAVTVRVDAVNLLADRLYLRLGGLRLIGPNGPIALDQAPPACAVPARGTRTVLHATAWVPAEDASGIRGLEVEQLAVPLSERGRAFYREFLLRKRGGPVSTIDAELDTYAAAPPCANP
jgi:hypothetical protein